jgi:hypothetical protein
VRVLPLVEDATSESGEESAVQLSPPTEAILKTWADVSGLV